MAAADLIYDKYILLEIILPEKLPNKLNCLFKSLTMINRRKFIHASLFTSFATLVNKKIVAGPSNDIIAGKPVVISTWDAGLEANKAAWEVLKNKGRAIDAVEKGVMVTEASQNCCVGL
ncbi:MAG TPA: hypothetical protein VJ508_12500, partial [Saprospiraceae bacterium]|nr:hypothetical protein [Saprospiraceae bacterium]